MALGAAGQGGVASKRNGEACCWVPSPTGGSFQAFLALSPASLRAAEGTRPALSSCCLLPLPTHPLSGPGGQVGSRFLTQAKLGPSVLCDPPDPGRLRSLSGSREEKVILGWTCRVV